MKSIKAIRTLAPRFQVALESAFARSYIAPAANFTAINSNGMGNGIVLNSRLGLQVFEINRTKITIPGYSRSLASRSSESTRQSSSDVRFDFEMLAF